LNGADLQLLTVADREPCAADQDGYCLRSFAWDYSGAPLLNVIRASSAMHRALCSAAETADVVHDHGLWRMPNVYAGNAAAEAGKPLVVAPRGMLSPEALSFSAMKKKVFWHLMQKSAIASAACFHATSEKEYRDIRAAGFLQPVAIIPNGIDIPDQLPGQTRTNEATLTVLSLARIHPIKGLDILLHAWQKISESHPDWRLRIIGPSENGHADSLRRFVAEQRLRRVSIEDALYGEEKSRVFQSASLFVLPSRSENYGMAVAEALAAGAPAITTKGTPWRDLQTEDCGWWIDHGIDSLAAALSTAMTLPASRLSEMGQKGRSWIARAFSWNRVARDMLDLYAWLAMRADMPRFVRTDAGKSVMKAAPYTRQ
jgi:glycosyltransferase involved in cell wall biosynthesis